MRCWWCLEEERDSARHMWAECSRFQEVREALQKEFCIPPGWWCKQPRRTAKSGWVTFSAGSTVEERSSRMVAACKLGVEVVKACWEQNERAFGQGPGNKRRGGEYAEYAPPKRRAGLLRQAVAARSGKTSFGIQEAAPLSVGAH